MLSGYLYGRSFSLNNKAKKKYITFNNFFKEWYEKANNKWTNPLFYSFVGNKDTIVSSGLFGLFKNSIKEK